MSAWLALIPIGAIIGLLTWWLGLRTRVSVTGQHTTGTYGWVMISGPPPEPHDIFAFKARNRSLIHPVFVRSLGATGRGPDGKEVSAESWLASESIRLERGQMHPWEMTFGQLAKAGIDVRHGVRGWVVLDQRDRRYRSRVVKPGPTGNRAIPLPVARMASR